MARDPNIPDAFDVYTLVVLRRPADAPDLPEAELDTLQARHLAYRADLRRRGILVVNGPFDRQSDELSSVISRSQPMTGTESHGTRLRSISATASLMPARATPGSRCSTRATISR